MATQNIDRQTSPYSVDLAAGERPPSGFVRGRTVVLLCAALVVGLVGLNLFSTLKGRARDDRKAADQMVLYSVKTAHTFAETSTGVTERFVAKNPADTSTLTSIRLATQDMLLIRRNVGDYSVNKQKDLVGREELENGIEFLDVKRTEIESGVELTYSSNKPELQKALRDWSESQAKQTS